MRFNGWRYRYPIIVGQFHFVLTGNSNPVTGWTLLTGDPNLAIMSATETRISGQTVGITTVGTGDTNWTDNGIAAAGFVTETHTNGDFPAAVGSGYLFNNSTSSPTTGNLHITGLNPLGTYKLEILSDRPTVTDNRLTVISIIDNITTVTNSSVNSAPSSSTSSGTYRQVTNAGSVVIANGLQPKSDGKIWIRIHAAAGYSFGYVNAIRVTRTA